MKPKRRILTPADIEAAGRTLYGDNWRAKMAAAMGVEDRTLRYRMKGKLPASATTWVEAALLLHEFKTVLRGRLMPPEVGELLDRTEAFLNPPKPEA